MVRFAYKIKIFFLHSFNVRNLAFVSPSQVCLNIHFHFILRHIITSPIIKQSRIQPLLTVNLFVAFKYAFTYLGGGIKIRSELILCFKHGTILAEHLTEIILKTQQTFSQMKLLTNSSNKQWNLLGIQNTDQHNCTPY